MRTPTNRNMCSFPLLVAKVPCSRLYTVPCLPLASCAVSSAVLSLPREWPHPSCAARKGRYAHSARSPPTDFLTKCTRACGAWQHYWDFLRTLLVLCSMAAFVFLNSSCDSSDTAETSVCHLRPLMLLDPDPAAPLPCSPVGAQSPPPGGPATPLCTVTSGLRAPKPPADSHCLGIFLN